MKIIVVKEVTDAYGGVGNNWLETKSFKPTDTILDVLEWAKGKWDIALACKGGRLMLTVEDE